MKIKAKLTLFFCVFLFIACAASAVVSYKIAANGFEETLGLKAQSDAHMALEFINAKDAGDWEIRGGKLYKGAALVDENVPYLAKLKDLTGNHVTFFLEDTRIATTVVLPNGKQATGTKASAAVIDQVLKKSQSYMGFADVLGNRYYSVYLPLVGAGGKVVGMIFMGIPTETLNRVGNQFITMNALCSIALVIIIGAIVFFTLTTII